MHICKRTPDTRRVRGKTTTRLQRALHTGPRRTQELEKLYEEFRRNKSVDL